MSEEFERRMHARNVIDAAYRAHVRTEWWLADVIEALAPVLDEGYGVAGTVVATGASGFSVLARVVRGESTSSTEGGCGWLLPTNGFEMGAYCLNAAAFSRFADFRQAALPALHEIFGPVGVGDGSVFVGHAAAPSIGKTLRLHEAVSITASPRSPSLAT